jgi:hypothetical protein
MASALRSLSLTSASASPRLDCGPASDSRWHDSRQLSPPPRGLVRTCIRTTARQRASLEYRIRCGHPVTSAIGTMVPVSRLNCEADNVAGVALDPTESDSADAHRCA